jgi:hypothetical protein
MRKSASSGGFRRNEKEKNEARDGVRNFAFGVLNAENDENSKTSRNSTKNRSQY